MTTPPTARQRVYALVGALLGWSTLMLQLYLIVNANIASGKGGIFGVLNFISYFTILTNILVTLTFTEVLLPEVWNPYFARPSVVGATALYIAIVGIIYSLVLRKLWNPTGLQLVADHVLHDVMPVVYLVYWLIFVRKGLLRWPDAARWVVFPAVYVAWVLARGSWSGFYPYPFMDVTKLGFPRVLANTAGLFVAFLVAGVLLIALDHALGRTRAPAEPQPA
jgi:hypothetical protein